MKPIAGNTRDGRLMYLGGGMGFEGERRTKNGKFETKRFDTHNKGQALFEWNKWKQEVKATSTIEVAKPHKTEKKEVGKVATAKQATQKKDEAYVVAFIGQRSRKDVAIYFDMDAAAKMVDALSVALDATEMEGQYDVFKLPVWG